MPLAYVTKTGNVSIPKKWRDELGIDPNSNVIIRRIDGRIVLEPLKKDKLANIFKKIDEEVKKKRISFSREEAVKDDLYD